VIIARLGCRIGVVGGGIRRRRGGVDGDEVCDGIRDKECPFEGVEEGSCESDAMADATC
jgi:hypothetical protein